MPNPARCASSRRRAQRQGQRAGGRTRLRRAGIGSALVRGGAGHPRAAGRTGLVAGHRPRAAVMSDAGSGRTRVGVDIGGTFTDLVARGGERTRRSRACPGNLRGRHRDHGERRAGPHRRAWTRPPLLRAARNGWGGPGPCLVSRREARYRAPTVSSNCSAPPSTTASPPAHTPGARSCPCASSRPTR